MRFILPVFTVPFLVGLFTACSESRAAFNPAVVAGDAQWVVYMDLNALRSSVVGKELVATMQKQTQQADMPVDLRLNVDKIVATIGSITAYGANLVPDPNKLDGALVIQGTADFRKIAEGMLVQMNLSQPKAFAEEPGMPFSTYRVQGQVLISFPPEPIVIISKSKPQLTKAYDVFRGNAPSLAKTPTSALTPLLRGSDGALLVAASTIPADVRNLPDGPQTRFVQLVEAGGLHLREVGPKTAAHLELLAADNSAADKLQKVVDGSVAVLSLVDSLDPDIKEFLQSTQVGRRERAVSLDLAYSSERLVTLLREAMAPKPAKEVGVVSQASSNGRPEPKVVSTWTLEPPAQGAAPVEATIAARTTEHVQLTTGSIVSLAARRQGQGNPNGSGRFDVVEITPAAGGAPLRFEAENMRLSRYNSVTEASASGRRVIALSATNGHASFEFPGAEGDYTVTVRYLDRADAKTTFTVTVQDPVPNPERN